MSSQGIRGPELGNDELRILAIGGSTTECLYLDDAKVWPAVVRAALPRTRDGRAVWIGNAGKAGANSRDHVVQLEHLVEQLPRLDTVLVLVGVNDVTLALAAGDHYVAPQPITEPDAARRQALRAFSIPAGRIQDILTDDAAVGASFYKRTALYQLAKRAINRTRARELIQDGRGHMYGRWRENRRHAAEILTRMPDLDAPLAEYRRNLGALADIAERRQIRLVLMTQPTLWRADLPDYAVELLWLGGVGDFLQGERGKAYYSVAVMAEMMRRYNEVVLDVCHERRLSCLDLAARIPKETTMFYDDTHFTEAGSRAVAVAVAEHLGGLLPFAHAGPSVDRPAAALVRP